MGKPSRKVIFEIGENNKIINHAVLGLDKETENYKPVDMDLGLTLLYIYEYCNGIEILTNCGEEKEMEAEQAEKRA